MAGQNVLNGDLNVLKQVISDISEYSANREELDRQNDTLKEINRNIESIQKKKGKLASKAGMVQQYNEKSEKKNRK